MVTRHAVAGESQAGHVPERKDVPGLKALGVSDGVLGAFPAAFSAGPAERQDRARRRRGARRWATATLALDRRPA